jgi:hypothetical protein
VSGHQGWQDGFRVLHMTSERLVEMFEGDFADTRTNKFPLGVTGIESGVPGCVQCLIDKDNKMGLMSCHQVCQDEFRDGKKVYALKGVNFITEQLLSSSAFDKPPLKVSF